MVDLKATGGDAMITAAPPGFLEFAGGAVLVAHNAAWRPTAAGGGWTRSATAGTRLVRTAEPWCEPAPAAGRRRRWPRQAEAGRASYLGADRALRPVACRPRVR